MVSIFFYNFDEKNKINLNYEYTYSKYKYENFAFQTKRKDKNQVVELSLQHMIDKTSIINISSSYTKKLF